MSTVEHRQRLVRFYEKYNPSKLDTVDATLAKFAGAEDALFKALVQKYGPEPSAAAAAAGASLV